MLEHCTKCDEVPMCDLTGTVADAIPIIYTIKIVHTLIGFSLIVLPMWKPWTAKAIMVYWVLQEVLEIHKPFEYGPNYGEFVAKTFELIFFAFSTNFWVDSLTLILGYVAT